MDTERLNKKYHGDMSETYDRLRQGTPLWEGEQRAVEEYLSRFGPGTTVLDMPVGTGRFFDVCANSGFTILGMDISTDMLAEAQRKAIEKGFDVSLEVGDVFSLALADQSFDVSLCIRLMQWLNAREFERALVELSRVSRKAIILYVPVYTPLRHLRPLSPSGFMRLFKQWKLRFYLARTRSDFVVHETAEVHRIFDRLALRVEDRVRVETSETWEWKRGVEITTFLLEPTHAV